MLMPDFSVWALNFPVKPETCKSNSLSRVVISLIRGFNLWLLLAISIAICVIVPYLVSLAIYMALDIP